MAVGGPGANSSLGADPCSAGKIQGNILNSGTPGSVRVSIPEQFRDHRRRIPYDQEQAIHFRDQGNLPERSWSPIRIQIGGDLGSR
jgi:hypothetical protein